jgi:uncharacterized protein (DUF934 family)
MKLLTAQDLSNTDAADVLTVANDVDVQTLSLDGVTRIDLVFPKFTDGRAFSQAFELRRRLGYTGTLRATGDVLIDQLVQMQRCGFTEAVLRADQDRAHGEKLLHHFSGFYQGDATQLQPHFAQAA